MQQNGRGFLRSLRRASGETSPECVSQADGERSDLTAGLRWSLSSFDLSRTIDRSVNLRKLRLIRKILLGEEVDGVPAEPIMMMTDRIEKIRKNTQ